MSNEKDFTEKILFDLPDVFADIFNVLLFEGKQIIKPEDLVSDGTVSQLKIANDLHMQERDVSKIWTKGNARLRHVAGTQWGCKKYMNMKHLEALEQDQAVG